MSSCVRSSSVMATIGVARYPGVRPYQLYRFEIQNPTAGTDQNLDPAARDVLSSELTRSDPSDRNGSVVQGTDPFPWAPFQTPAFENFIIYQFHIGSFAGRGDEFDKLSSDFQDIESKFSYIREMGFNCIQPLPVHEFAMDRSWGYNPASFFAPESSYGSPLQPGPLRGRRSPAGSGRHLRRGVQPRRSRRQLSLGV